MSDFERTVQVLANIALIATLVVSIYAYFHTVVPIFQKERLAEESARQQAKNVELQAEYSAALAAFVSVAIRTHAAAKWNEMHLAQPRVFREPGMSAVDATIESVSEVLSRRAIDPIALLDQAANAVISDTSLLSRISPERLKETVEETIAARKVKLASYPYPDITEWARKYASELESLRSACKIFAQEKNRPIEDENLCIRRMEIWYRSNYDGNWDFLEMNALNAIWDEEPSFIEMHPPELENARSLGSDHLASVVEQGREYE